MESRPKLKSSDWPWISAFMKLSEARQVAMGGFQAITLTEIMSGAEVFKRMGLLGLANSLEWAKYVTLMQDLDRVWLEHHAKAEEANRKTPAQQSGRRG